MFLVCYQKTNLPGICCRPAGQRHSRRLRANWCLSRALLIKSRTTSNFVPATELHCPGTREEDMNAVSPRVAAACPDVYTMSVVPQWFDVPKGVSKLTGFETLLERTGISQKRCLFLEMARMTSRFLSKSSTQWRWQIIQRSSR